MRDEIQRLSNRSEFFLIVALCFGYYAISSVIVLILGMHEFHMTTARVVRAIFTEILLLSIAASVLRVRGWQLERLGFRFTWGAFFAGVPLFIAYIASYWLMYALVVSLYPPARGLQPLKMIPDAPFAIFAVFVVVNSVFEETAVTGYVVSALSEQGAALSITASALIRFTYHLYQGPVASMAILPLGLLFAAVYWRWRNLWPLMTAHTIANLLVFAMATRSPAAG